MCISVRTEPGKKSILLVAIEVLMFIIVSINTFNMILVSLVNLYKLGLNLPYVEYLCTVLIGDVISQTECPKEHDEIFYMYFYCILFRVIIRENDGPVHHNIASQTGMPEVKRPKRMTSSYLRR